MLTALLLSMTIAANVETRLRTAGVLADATQKAGLGTAIEKVFPGAVGDAKTEKAAAALASTRNFNCRHQDNDMAKPFGCDGWYKQRATVPEMIDLQIAGKAGPALGEGAPEGMADFYHLVDFALVGPDGEKVLDDMVKVMFLGLELADIYDFRCEKQDGEKSVCQAVYDDIVNEATAHSLSKAKFVVKTLRRVP